MEKDKALKMIKQAFDYAVKTKNIDENTAKTYFGTIRHFMNSTLEDISMSGTDKKSKNAFNPKFWKAEWVDTYFDTLIDRFHGNGTKPVSGSYIERSVHAFGKLQELVNKEKVWQKTGINKLRVGLKGSIQSEQGRLYKIYCEGATSSKDEITSMKGTEKDYRQFIQSLDKVITKNDKNYVNVKAILTSQRHTGGRITAEVNLKVRDIDSTNMTKRYDKDKNNFTRRVLISSKQLKFYEGFTKDEKGNPKSDGTPLFPLYDKAGKQMSKEKASKYVQTLVKKIAQDAGLYEIGGKRYTSHTSRRIFSQQLYNSTRFMTKKQIDKKIAEYINLQGSNKEGIVKRIERERRRINYYRIKNKKPMKDFTWNQKRKLLVMLNLGHSRIDTVNRYIVPDKPFWKKDK